MVLRWSDQPIYSEVVPAATEKVILALLAAGTVVKVDVRVELHLDVPDTELMSRCLASSKIRLGQVVSEHV